MGIKLLAAMTTADIVILLIVGLSGAAAIAYMIKKRIQNKKNNTTGCGGCTGCGPAKPACPQPDSTDQEKE